MPSFFIRSFKAPASTATVGVRWILLLLLLLLCATIPRAHASEEATLSFLQQLRDAFPETLQNKWVGNNYCNGWAGITCRGNDPAQVILNVSNFGLKGTLPEPPSSLDNEVDLVTIDFSHNLGIYGSIPYNWQVMSERIEKMYLVELSISGTFPTSFSRMRYLTDMYVTHTNLCKRITTLNLQSMTRIDYSHNKFTGSLPYYWGLYPKLQRARLVGNNFCGCIPERWKSSPLLLTITPLAFKDVDCDINNECPPGANQFCEATLTPPVLPTTTTTTTRPPTTTTTTKAPTATTTTRAPVASSSLFTPSEKLYTQRALASFVAAIPALNSVWSGNDFCQYRGVTCFAASRLVGVNLHNWGVAGNAPTFDSRTIAGNYVRIYSIDLGGNTGLSGTFPDSWSSLARLENIDVSRTSLTGTLPYQWGALPLRVLLANNAGVRGPLPNWALRTMYYMDLCDNRFTSPLPASWSAMNGIAELRISGNALCGCLPASWRTVPVLANAATGVNAALGSATCSTTNACNPATTAPITTPRPTRKVIVINSAGERPTFAGRSGGAMPLVTTTMLLLCLLVL